MKKTNTNRLIDIDYFDSLYIEHTRMGIHFQKAT